MSTPLLTICRPDDWHLHVRDDAALAAVLPHTAAVFGRAVVMPNLKPPVRTTDEALAYRERIRAATPPGADFEPLMTLYLTGTTQAAEIDRAVASGAIIGVKYYPAGATTNSDAGLRDLGEAVEVLERMQDLDLPLLVHGEVTDPAVDTFDREACFIDRVLAPLVRRLPRLRIVFEHATTREAVMFVRDHPHLAATLTPQHLLLNRTAMFTGGLRPHLYCLPVLKRESHREALIEAAVSGSPQFFLGTDSAPHGRSVKETACGCAGVYSAHAALPLYAEAFESMGRLERLEGFASHHGADFYRLPRNRGTVTLVREEWLVPESYEFGTDRLVPFRAGETLPWRVAGVAA
jgi:dihydroorotase